MINLANVLTIRFVLGGDMKIGTAEIKYVNGDLETLSEGGANQLSRALRKLTVSP